MPNPQPVFAINMWAEGIARDADGNELDKDGNVLEAVADTSTNNEQEQK